jgi:hypothetical protein
MNESDFISILQQYGWKCRADEVGVCVCFFDINEKVVAVIPTIGKRVDHFRVSLMPSISSVNFSSCVAFIAGEEIAYEPIFSLNESPEKLSSLLVEDVLRLSEKAITWADTQSLEDGLVAYRNLPTKAKGAMPLRHLAALAVAGDVARLVYYRKSFEQGDRLGFVPYITSEMLDRAIELAKQYQT